MSKLATANEILLSQKLKWKQSLTSYNFLYIFCFISVLTITFGSTGFINSGALAMIGLQHIVYSPSVSSIFCLLGIASLAFVFSSREKQKELAPFIVSRKVIVQLDFLSLLIYSFYFTLASLFLPYVNLAVKLLFSDSTFIRGYTVFHNPWIGLLNAIGIFLVFYLCSLLFYGLGLIWRKNRGIIIGGNVLLIVLEKLVVLPFSLAVLPWSSALFFYFFVSICILLMLVTNYWLQRKWEVQ